MTYNEPTSSSPVIHPDRASRFDATLHVVLALIGAVSLVITVAYYISIWRDLHAQGVGHLYLILATALCFWWFVLIVCTCFAGNFLLSKQSGRPLLRRVGFALLGAVVSMLLPQYMVAAWSFGALLVRSLL